MQDANISVFGVGCLTKADDTKDTDVVGALAHTGPRFVLGFVFHITRSPTKAVVTPNCHHQEEPEDIKRQPKQAP